MKVNIKMRVTPEQSKQVQKIVFANGGYWSVSLLQEELYLSAPFLYLELLEYCTEDEIKKEKILIYGEEEELFLKADGYKEIDADLFIRTNGTCEETKEENKMEWIEYNGQELQNYRNYLVCFANGNIDVWEFNCRLADNKSDWKQVIAFQGLPKPYEKPKSLKERLDEAIDKYCCNFSDKELNNEDLHKFFIYYNQQTKTFKSRAFTVNNFFSKYLFNHKSKALMFINAFTTEELYKIMKGEVK